MTPPLVTHDGLRAIVFDLDGTLYRDDRLGVEVNLSACRYLAHLLGITAAKADPILHRMRSDPGKSGETLSRSVLALGGDLKELHRRFNEEIHPEAVLTPDPRVPELLRKLAARFELYIYTNNNRALSDRIMAQIGVCGFFDRVFTIEDYWRPKPDRVVLQGILDDIGRCPGETLFVGDRYEVDLKLPASLGCGIFETKTVEELLALARLVEAG